MWVFERLKLNFKFQTSNLKPAIGYSLTFVNLNISYDHQQAGTYIR